MPGNNRITETLGAKVVLILILILTAIPGLCDHGSRSLAWPGV